MQLSLKTAYKQVLINKHFDQIDPTLKTDV